MQTGQGLPWPRPPHVRTQLQGRLRGGGHPASPVAGNVLLPAVSLQDFPGQFPPSLCFLLPPPQLLAGFVVRPHDAHTHFSWPQPGVGSLPCFMNKQLAPGHKAELRPQAWEPGLRPAVPTASCVSPAASSVACRGSQPAAGGWCWHELWRVPGSRADNGLVRNVRALAALTSSCFL